MAEAVTVLDVKGLKCPMPVLRANKVLRGLPPGARLQVLATDKGALTDFRAFCHETGHALVSFSEADGVLSFTIRKRRDPQAEAIETASGEAG